MIRRHHHVMSNPILTMNDDVNQLYNRISPSHYREFRQLHSELMGYFDRKEFDKIEEFSKRMTKQMVEIYSVQHAFFKEIQAFKYRQGHHHKKTIQQYRFRHPRTTIPITHPFPLKYPVEPLADAATQAHDPSDGPDDALVEPTPISVVDDDMVIVESNGTVIEDMVTPSTDIDTTLQTVGDAHRTETQSVDPLPDDPIDLPPPSGTSVKNLSRHSAYLDAKHQSKSDIQRAQSTLPASGTHHPKKRWWHIIKSSKGPRDDTK